MKSQLNAVVAQSIVGDGTTSATVGYVVVYRINNSDGIRYFFANGTISTYIDLANFFQNLDNQWVHITTVCDYTNKTLKFYRNGIQFGATQNLTGTPVFPSIGRARYVGAYTTNANRITDGYLDEVKIYNRELSASEIASIYNQTKGKYQ